MNMNFLNNITLFVTGAFILAAGTVVLVAAVLLFFLLVIAVATTYGAGTAAVICFGLGLLVSVGLGTLAWFYNKTPRQTLEEIYIQEVLDKILWRFEPEPLKIYSTTVH